MIYITLEVEISIQTMLLMPYTGRNFFHDKTLEKYLNIQWMMNVIETIYIETFREYSMHQNKMENNPYFDHKLMQQIDKFMHSNEI